MHLIGRTVKVTATLPDGTSQSLISIGDWDFNWQHYYQYATPLRLPAGTRLDGRFTYDNSADNPANPSQPPRRVTYGEQTADEMAIVVLDVIPAVAPTPPPRRMATRATSIAERPTETPKERPDVDVDFANDPPRRAEAAGGRRAGRPVRVPGPRHRGPERDALPRQLRGQRDGAGPTSAR